MQCPVNHKEQPSECPKKFESSTNTIANYTRLHSNINHQVMRNIQESDTQVTPANFMYPVFIT